MNKNILHLIVFVIIYLQRRNLHVRKLSVRMIGSSYLSLVVNFGLKKSKRKTLHMKTISERQCFTTGSSHDFRLNMSICTCLCVSANQFMSIQLN